MRPLRVAIRNVRGAGDVELHIRPFSALIGPNNAGKSTLLDAIRLFYGSLDWTADRDRPWDAEPDAASWVEIDFEVTADEARNVFSLEEAGVLRIRRWFTDGDEHQAGAYHLIPLDGSEPLPTGWSNAAKLGQCVYIPAQSQPRDHTSVSDSSPLRDVLLLAFTEQFTDGMLTGARHVLAALEGALAKGPINELESDLDEALSPWGLSVKVKVNELTNEMIMRHLVELHLQHGGVPRSVETQGSGVQRSLIAALIQTAAKMRAGSDEFRWILFEEPEAFLHPSQVTRLAQNLRKLTSGNTAVTITTHDPTMLSSAEAPPEAIVRVRRSADRIEATSPTPERVASVLADIHLRATYALGAASPCFRRPRLTPVDEEHHRVLYDLDSRRAAAFFADRVIVVEGPSDVLFFEWLDRRGLLAGLGGNIGVLDSFGKYELHRASSSLSLFGIPHVVLWDEDAAMPHATQNLKKKRICQDDAALAALTASANDSGSSFAGAIRLTGTIEHWLGIPEESEGRWKAANIAASLTRAYNDPSSSLPAQVDSLLALLTSLFNGTDLSRHRAASHFAGALIERRLPDTGLSLAAEVAALPRPACTCPDPAWP